MESVVPLSIEVGRKSQSRANFGLGLSHCFRQRSSNLVSDSLVAGQLRVYQLGKGTQTVMAQGRSSKIISVMKRIRTSSLSIKGVGFSLTRPREGGPEPIGESSPAQKFMGLVSNESCWVLEGRGVFSQKLYLSITFRKSTPRQNR